MLADFTAVLVHGIIGHRALLSPMGRERLLPTPAFGDEDMGRRVLVVSWHVVTAAFACSGAAYLLLALGSLESAALPRFLGSMHGVFLLVGLSIMGGRMLTALRRPIPITFGLCMSTACVMGWLD
jgi:hypothetical protein